MAIRRGTLICFYRPVNLSPQPFVGHNLRKLHFGGQLGKLNVWSSRAKAGSGLWRKLFTSEAKAAVRAIPVEAATRSRWSGDQIGRAILAGGSLFGIGSLCFYGLGLSNEVGAIDKIGLWSSEVKARVNKTYGFFAYSLTSTAAAAYVAMRNSSAMRFMTARPYVSMALFLVGSIGSMILTQSIPYAPESLPLKIGAFTLFSSIVGATMAPLLGIAGPLVARAAAYTAGVVGGLTLTAACAPSEKYLSLGGPLSLGLGIVLVASIGGMFAAPGGAVFSGLHAVYMYGGLVLFGGFMLYDTHKIIHHAENDYTYDPINRSIGIYLDTVNIFTRILFLMMGSGGRKK